MSRNRGILLGGLAAGLLISAGWRIYQQRARERIPGHEGLEDPEITGAFARIARMPQMHWLRSYVVNRAAALKTQGEAVDLGCGPGYLVVELASRLPGLQVTGVDLSQEMLITASEFAWESGVGDWVAFRQGDAQQIPFPDASLDLVVSTLSLHHWSNPVVVFNEIARVLKPGGAFLIFDLRRDMLPPFYLLIWAATRWIVPPALRRIKEPLNSRNAAYTPREVGIMALGSQLTGWQVGLGPLWLVLEGCKQPTP